jgi:hypothetical protein
MPLLACHRSTPSFALALVTMAFGHLHLCLQIRLLICLVGLSQQFPPTPPWLRQAEGEAVICGLPFHCSLSNTNALILPCPEGCAGGAEGQRDGILSHALFTPVLPFLFLMFSV